jgi:hypothetical protein
MTTVIRAAGAADFLALVPRLTGYLPARSVMLVPFAGNRTAGGIRFDLPDTTDHLELDRITSTLIGLICKVAHTDAVAAVIYTDRAFRDGDGMPHEALARSIIARADLCGLRMSEALCVAADGWGSYLDPQTPAGGHPLTEIPYDDEAFADMPVDADVAAGAELPGADLVEKERVARLLGALDDVSAATPDDPDPLDDLPQLFEDALAWQPEALPAAQSALLVYCLARPALRDIALVQWSADLAKGDAAFDAQLAWADGAPYPPELAATMWGDGPSPDPERLIAALELCRRAAAVAPREVRPGPLSACAWLAWALGRSSHAARYAEAAREIDPHHGMAEIVLTMVGNAHLPEWAFDRPAPPDTPVTRLVDSAGVENRAARRRRERAARRAT